MDADDEIQAAVTIQIGEDGAGRPVLAIHWLPGQGHFWACRFDVLPFAVAEEQPIAMTDEEVRPPVVIEIRNRERKTIEVGGKPHDRRDVNKSERSQVPAESAMGGAAELILQHEEIERAVSIVVKNADAPRRTSPGEACAADLA